jgi:glycosyltransferase involved in cell wall biosynthesis
MTDDVAIIRGPYFRPNSTLLWEYVHNAYDDINVTGFESNPAWFDTSELKLPIERLHWWDGKLDAFGRENILYRALEKYGLPSIALSGIKRVVDTHDAVHVTENYRLYSCYTALYGAGTDTKVFVDCHENIPHRPANPVTWAMKRAVNARADAFTAPTPASKRALIHEGVDADAVKLLPNVVNLDRFDTAPKDTTDLPLPEALESSVNYLFVHGLNKRKGTYYLLDAFERLQFQHDDMSLVLLGDNSLPRQYYETYVESNPDVYHIEYVPDIERLYNASDVFVLPSIPCTRWKEQFGRAIIEAMACGLPSIVTDAGGPPYVVAEGETSLVVKSRSTDALAEAMADLYDPERRRAMGEHAYEYVRDVYAPDVVGDELYAFYREHLKQ